MNDIMLNSTTFGIVISLIGYELGLIIRKKTNKAVFNPLLISIIFVMVFLVATGIDYETYNSSAKYLSYLLTPATVCLAIPLYEKIHLLKKHFIAIMIGIISGVISSMGSILGLSILFKLTHAEYVTLLPKSITTAIGMGLSEEFGGIVTVTIASIIITGVLGNMMAESLCKLANVTHPIAKGIAIGTSSHAIGTARAMEMGEVEGAMSSLAIVVAGLCTVVGASVFVQL